MSTCPSLSWPTRRNWGLDAALLMSAALAALSGIYFLFLPVGGFQGGRNPFYGAQIIFDRSTWEALHTWSGVAMIGIAAAHLGLHGKWVTTMARRTLKELTGQCGCVNPRGRWNLLLNLAVAVTFLLTAVSGVYFLFAPGGRGALDPGLLFARSIWDLAHTWAGMALIIAAGIHFAIHWRWVVKVTGQMATSFVVGQAQPKAVASPN